MWTVKILTNVGELAKLTLAEKTRNGKGLQTESGHWINNDLCSADRRANFLACEEKRKRLKDRSL